MRKTHITTFAFLLFLGTSVILGAESSRAVVFKMSEGIKPGNVFSLYGEYLNGPGEVRFLGPDGFVLATQSAVQTDSDGHFLRAIFPDITPGVYRISVRNDAGWSETELDINKADPRWLSDDRTYPGQKLKLIGRNLDAAEYGGITSTLIRLVSADDSTSKLSAYTILPDSVNPYCVDFTVSQDTPPGTYQVEVNTRGDGFGNRWIPLDNRSEYPQMPEITLITVEPAPTNRLASALNVSWANDFNWERVIDIKSDCGAKGDGSDETEKITEAVKSLGESGGVIFFPEGVYGIKRIELPSGCILLGEHPAKSVLVAHEGGDTLQLKGERHGIASLRMKFHEDVPVDRQSYFLGGTAKKLFIYQTTFDFLRNPDIFTQHRPYYVKGDGPMLVAECVFFRHIWNHEVKNRVVFRNNFIEMHDGQGFCMSSEKLLLFGNEMVFKPADYSGQMNGFFINEGWMGWNIYNAYVANNITKNLNGPGDCQPFALDSAWSCFAGPVMAATARTVETENDLDAKFAGLETHELEVIITQGKGLGQLRRVTKVEKLGGNPEKVRLTVSPDWDVPPDETSYVGTGSWHLNSVFYKNISDISKTPYNMYYGGCYDCVDADAISIDTEGWYNWGRLGEMPDKNIQHPNFGNSWFNPVYFSQLKRSRFTGQSPLCNTMGLTLRVENETTRYLGVMEYGTEIRDNEIDRKVCMDTPQRLANKAPAAIATFVQRWEDTTGTPGKPSLLATLCDGNLIKNSTQGFNLFRCTGFAIHNTKYENCEIPVVDNGIGTTIIPIDR